MGAITSTTERYAQELSRRVGIPAVDYRKMGEISLTGYSYLSKADCMRSGLVGLKKSLPKLKRQQQIWVICDGRACWPGGREEMYSISEHRLQSSLEELTAKETTFIHLRGGIDYGKLNMLHRTMMRDACTVR